MIGPLPMLQPAILSQLASVSTTPPPRLTSCGCGGRSWATSVLQHGGQLPQAPIAAWHAATAELEGMAADFAATAASAVWKDDLLEVTLPAAAATAASFLRRPDSVAAITAALGKLAGRPLRYAVVVGPPVTIGEPAAIPRPAVPSQAALMRAATEHPFVAQARSLFDAAIRKVEPPRPAAATAPPGETTAGAIHADNEAEESDG